MTLLNATLVFCDVVGFSTYPDEKQHQIIISLNAEVGKELFPWLGMFGSLPKVICLPTGDGLLIVMFEPEPKLLFSLVMTLRLWCDAVTRRAALKSACQLRVGVHVGTVSIVPDINRLPNVCGDSINTCRRIMDHARPNQALFSVEAHAKYIGVPDGAYSGDPFSGTQSAIFSDSTVITVKHDKPIQVRVMTQRGNSRWTSDSPLSVPRVIEGQEAMKERTQFINKQLESLFRSKRKEIKIYEQTSFSTFAIEPETEEMQKHDSTTIKLLQKQKELLEALLKRNGTKIKVLLRPIPTRASDFKEENIRYRTLAVWMDANLNFADGDPVEFLEFAAPKDAFESAFPNRLIVTHCFRVDGYRLRGIKGHGLSLIYFDEEKINQAASFIEERFASATIRDAHNRNRTIREKLRVFEKVA